METKTEGAERVCIIADDLTGALDTAGSFASPSLPFEVSLGDGPAHGTRVAIDTDSRDRAEHDAVLRVSDVIGTVDTGTGALVFKKIDSVMRGHPIAETVATFRTGGFDRALVAPAFPALGRVTREGRQMVRHANGMRPVGPSLPEAFRAHGLQAVRLADARGSAEIIVADAEDDDDLHRAIGRIAELGGRTLYVGSAGLAQALAAPGTRTPLDALEIDLAICGTSHPATLAQIGRLMGLPIAVETMDGGAGRSLDVPTVYVAPTQVVSEPQARYLISQSLAALTRERRVPRMAMVTGGWTLRTLLEQTKAEELFCTGLYMPGVPVSRVVGGTWHDVTIISKSGGFGGSDFLRDLFSSKPKI